MPSILTDRIYSTAAECNRALVRWPFLSAPIPDRYTQTIARSFEVEAGGFVPTNADRTAVTNLLLQSNTFTSSSWTKTRSTAAAAAAVLTPDGTATVLLAEDATVTSTHFTTQAVTFATGTYVAYVLAKAGTRSRFELQLTGAAAKARGFDLSDGTTFQSTIVAGAPDDYGILAVSGGWYLCWIKYAITSGTSLEIYLNNGTSVTYSGDGASGLYLAYANLILGSAFGALIPTTTAARTLSHPAVDFVANPRSARAGAYSDFFAYQVTESDPLPNPINTVEKFGRTYSRIPGPQLIPSSLMLTKPVLPLAVNDQIVGSYYVNRPDEAIESYDAYFIQNVVQDSGPPNPYPTGGTYTLSFVGQTTASITYNDDAATIQTRLNALSNIVAFGSVVVTGAYNSAAGVIVTFNNLAAGSIDTSLLTTTATGAVITGQVLTSNFGMVQTVRVTASQSNATPSAFCASNPTLAYVQLAYGNGNFYLVLKNTSGSFAFTITAYGQTTGAITVPAYPVALGAEIAFFEGIRANIQAELNALSNVVARGAYAVVAAGQGGASHDYICTLGDATINGGTFAITILGQTTGAIAYNASAATIQTAVNALSNVTASGGAVITSSVTPPLTEFTINLNPVPLITPNVASLTIAPASIAATSSGIAGRAQTLIYTAAAPPRVVSIPGHGIVQATDAIFFSDGTTYYAGILGGTTPGTFSVISTDAIVLNTDGATVFAAIPTLTIAGKRTKADYRPGTTNIRCLLTTLFYLPGVSVGIDDYTDIPIPVNQSDNPTFLQAVFAATGPVNWQVGEIMPWLGPILQQTTTTLEVAEI